VQVEPAFDAFAPSYQAGRAQVVWTRLVADLETPVSAMLKLSAGRANAFLLESVEGGAVRGRYSIIGLDPDLVFRAEGERAAIERAGAGRPEPCAAPTLQAIRDLLAESRIELPQDLPPMAAGVFGYLGYDLVRLMERLPPAKPNELDLPDTMLVRPRIVVVFDSVKDELTVVTPVRPAPGQPAKAAYGQAVKINRRHLLGGNFTKIFVCAALNNPKLELLVIIHGSGVQKCFPATHGPAMGKIHRFFYVTVVTGIRRALIQDHHNIRSQCSLYFNNIFGRKKMLRTIKVTLKPGAFFC
jgi:hypothetical protein